MLKLREDAFAAVMERDMFFYDEYASGKIVSRVTSDTQNFAQVVTLTLNLLSQVLLVLVLVGVLFYINVRLTLLTLTIAAGETVALVGHTGAGKSSLGKLVARFCEFQGGQLLVDGHDIRSFDLAEYHRHLGIVPQTPFLFSGSVADNICYARPDASDETARAVAGQIGGGDWLEALPDGLDTTVGEGGRGLSMGQCQLIALALVLRQGQIIEEGTHDSLMAGGGHYAELYNTYFRHQSLDYHIPDAILS